MGLGKFHQPHEHEAQQFGAYHELEELVSQPEKLDEPARKEALISMVQSQLSCCAQAKGSMVEQSNSATPHSLVHQYLHWTWCLTGRLTRTQTLVAASSAALAEIPFL